MSRSAGRRGSAVFLVIMSLIAGVAITSIILSMILSQARLSHHQVSRIKAYYAGLAGMNWAIENLRQGLWSYNTYYGINCATCPGSWPSPSPCLAINPSNNLCDSDIPYQVQIYVGTPDPTNPGGSLRLDITTNYPSEP